MIGRLIALSLTRYCPDGSRDRAAGAETIDFDPAAHANAQRAIRMLWSFSSMTQSASTREPRAAEHKKHGNLAVIGLIGGIGSGKSRVAAHFEAAGAVVIDADVVGHELLNDPRVGSEIVDRFGTGVLSEKSTGPELPSVIDRKALGTIVFADPMARRDLETILHPRMRASFEAVIERESKSKKSEKSMVVLDAAILLEAGWDDLCDVIVFVDAPRDERMRRVQAQRGWSREAFEARERAQWPCDKKRRRADLVITNDAGVDGLQERVERILARLAELSCPLIETSNSR
jgi:dephospho-CoA kinase